MTDEKKAASRRDFLKLTGLAAPAAAVTVVAGATGAEAAAPAEAGGYRETEHVKKYFESARF